MSTVVKNILGGGGTVEMETASNSVNGTYYSWLNNSGYTPKAHATFYKSGKLVGAVFTFTVNNGSQAMPLSNASKVNYSKRVLDFLNIVPDGFRPKQQVKEEITLQNGWEASSPSSSNSDAINFGVYVSPNGALTFLDNYFNNGTGAKTFYVGDFARPTTIRMFWETN